MKLADMEETKEREAFRIPDTGSHDFVQSISCSIPERINVCVQTNEGKIYL